MPNIYNLICYFRAKISLPRSSGGERPAGAQVPHVHAGPLLSDPGQERIYTGVKHIEKCVERFGNAQRQPRHALPIASTAAATQFAQD